MFWHLPATVSKHEEENTEDDTGGADMDADDDAAKRCLSISAPTQTFLSWNKPSTNEQHPHDGKKPQLQTKWHLAHIKGPFFPSVLHIAHIIVLKQRWDTPYK